MTKAAAKGGLRKSGAHLLALKFITCQIILQMYLLGSPETYGILSTTKTQNENVTSCSASKYMNHALKSKCRYVNPYPQKTVLKG